MADFYYPPIPEDVVKQIEVVRQLSLEHPNYWANSPYPARLQNILREWFVRTKQVGAMTEDVIKKTTDGAKWEMLYKETEDLYSQLKEAKFDAEDNAERMSYFRTATSLLSKLIEYQERALNLKMVSDFQNEVLLIMDEVLSPTQRTEVMERLRKAAGLE